jgi:nucleotide-binding universal stress UspA family protein
MQLKRVLAATDFSECANRGIERAASIAACCGAQLRIVHAVPGARLLWSALRYTGDGVEASVREGAQTLLHSLAEDLGRRHGITVEQQLLGGAAHRAVGEAAEAFRPDLLVIGAHGEGLLEQVFLGGTAGKILTQAFQPVLVVRTPAQAPYAGAIAAVDLGPRSAAVIEWARAVAPGAALSVVHAFRAPFEGRLRASGLSAESLQPYRDAERAKAEQALAGLGVDAGSRRLIDGHPMSALLAAAQEARADLIVAARHSGTRFSDALLGSVPRFLAFHAPCDVLVV